MDGLDQGRHPGHQRTSHRRPAHIIVILFGAPIIHGHMIGGHGGKDRNPRSSNIHPIAIIREGRFFVLGVCGGHGQNMSFRRGIGGIVTIIIPCGSHHHHTVIIGIIDGIAHGVAFTAPAQTQIDNVRMMIHSMDHPFGHGVHRRAPLIIGEDLNGHDAGKPAGASHALTIVACGRDNACHMGAVPVGIGRIPIVFTIIIPGIGRCQAILEIGVRKVHARIHHGDHHMAGPLGDIPGPGALNLFMSPLILIAGIVGTCFEEIHGQIGLDESGSQDRLDDILRSLVGHTVREFNAINAQLRDDILHLTTKILAEDGSYPRHGCVLGHTDDQDMGIIDRNIGRASDEHLR